jgi:hypothetical protein
MTSRESFQDIARGLRLIRLEIWLPAYYVILFFVISIVGGAAGGAGPVLLPLLGLLFPVVWVLTLVVGILGRVYCVSGATLAGATMVVYASAVCSFVATLIAVANLATSILSLVIPAFPFGVPRILVELSLLTTLVSLALFLVFLRKVAKSIDQLKLEAKARNVLTWYVPVIVVLFAFFFAQNTVTALMLSRNVSCSALIVLLSVGIAAMIAFYKYEKLLISLITALKQL